MLESAVNVAIFAALFVALPAAWKRPELRPVAALVLLAGLGNPIRARLTEDVVDAQAAMRALGLDPLVAPLSGWARAEAHAMQALTMSWAPMVVAVVVMLIGQRARALGALWLVSVAVAVFGYAHLRGEAARDLYLANDLAALAMGARGLVLWMGRRRSAEAVHALAITLFLCEGARLLAYHRGPWATWDVARVPLLAEFLVTIAACGGALCCRSRSRCASSESR